MFTRTPGSNGEQSSRNTDETAREDIAEKMDIHCHEPMFGSDGVRTLRHPHRTRLAVFTHCDPREKLASFRYECSLCRYFARTLATLEAIQGRPIYLASFGSAAALMRQAGSLPPSRR